MADRYHHGDLRAQVLAAAARRIASHGADALSLRELAREIVVSHAAPAHHFGDRRGLTTALAAEGFGLLADALDAHADDFATMAVDYVRFALDHPGHYAVMFRPDLLDGDDPAFGDARRRAGDALSAGLASMPAASVRVDAAEARRAAWALVHGIASLHLAGVLDGDPIATTAAAAQQLLGPQS